WPVSPKRSEPVQACLSAAFPANHHHRSLLRGLPSLVASENDESADLNVRTQGVRCRDLLFLVGSNRPSKCGAAYDSKDWQALTGGQKVRLFLMRCRTATDYGLLTAC